MGIEICAVGGYNEVGKNMTAIRIDDDVIIVDMGIHLENYIRLTDGEDLINISSSKLIEVQAVPDINAIGKWRGMVKAIVPTHAHLDHVGAIPFLAHFYKAPVICSPFTKAVLSAILKDSGLAFRNEIKVLNVNSAIKVGNNTLEFVSMTHSTPQTVMVVLHTKYGKIVYANDYKFDNYPVLGTKANMKRLKEIGRSKNVLALILDSTYSRDHRKMPSESVAREMLKDVLLGTNSDGRAVVITTFSSHIARLKSIIDFGKKTGRKIVFVGRSLAKYVAAAEEVRIADFSKKVEIVAYSSKIRPRLARIMKEGKEKYLLVVTGHQAEPESTLSKMVRGMFHFERGDHVIFSSTVIPSETNKRNRQSLEAELDRIGVRVFKDIHVSGHAAREDQRDLIEMLMPRHIIPAHGERSMTSAVLDLAIELGYKHENVHVMSDGEFISIK